MQRILRKHLTGFLALVACLVTVFPPPAQAVDKRVYWRVVGAEGVSNPDIEAFSKALQRTLMQAEGTHYVGEKGMVALLEATTLQLPACFEGGPECGDVPVLLASALDVDGVVDCVIHSGAPGWEAELSLHRLSGGSLKRFRAHDKDLDGLVRHAVAELFTLEALITVYSDPPAATLFINGRLIGPTPSRVQLSEGTHVLRLEAEGYEPYRSDLAVTPGEQREMTAEMTAKLTQVTVVTRASDAAVLIDGAAAGMAGEAIDVLPGKHALELRAPCCRNLAITFEIEAGKRRQIPLAMLRKLEDPWVMRERGVRRFRLFAEAGYSLLAQDVGFAGATVDQQSTVLRPERFGDGDDATFLHNGLRLRAGYVQDWYGLELLSLGFMSASMSDPIQLRASDGSWVMARGDGASRVAITGLQPTARYLHGPFSALVSTGLGVGIDTLDATLEGSGAGSSSTVSLSETSWFWSFGLGGRFALSQEWFVGFEYRVELDFADGRGTRQGVVASLGFHLPFLVEQQSKAGQEAPDELLDESETPLRPGALAPSSTRSMAPESSTAQPNTSTE